MPKVFKVGDHVRWNSEAGRVSGVITKKVTSDMKFKATPITLPSKSLNT